MKKKEFVDEHVKLVKILRKGSKEEQLREANKQKKELETTVETSKKKSIRERMK